MLIAANGIEKAEVPAGTRALTLLSDPLGVAVLQALARGPVSLADLHRAAGSVPQSTMRERLTILSKVGILERRRSNDFPGLVDVELTRPGYELLEVAEVVQGWLASAPEEPRLFGSVAAQNAIKALVGSWAANIVRALASRPLSLTELDRALGLDYPSIQRRLTAMRRVGQVRALPGRGRSTPYAVTAWLRRAVVPMAAAIRWEGRHLQGQSSPVARRDAEAAFLLTIPLLRLSSELSGSCRLSVEFRGDAGSPAASVLIGVARGRVVSCAAYPEGHADAWVTGSSADWLAAMVEHDATLLAVGGEVDLAIQILKGLQESIAVSH